MVIGADSGMANRINNHILAIGCTKDIKALNQLLENIEKTIEVLSQGIFRICNPGKVFHPEDEEFDIIPFEGRKHWAWDIAFGKDAVLKVPARSRVSWGFEFLVGADPNKMEIESNEECLLFCYQHWIQIRNSIIFQKCFPMLILKSTLMENFNLGVLTLPMALRMVLNIENGMILYLVRIIDTV